MEELSGPKWYKPSSLTDLYAIMKEENSSHSVRLLVGNTGKGVKKVMREL
jgi:hypothetical protein